MKKLVLFVATIAVLAFAACTNKQTQPAEKGVDTGAVVVEDAAVVVDTVAGEEDVVQDEVVTPAN